MISRSEQRRQSHIQESLELYGKPVHPVKLDKKLFNAEKKGDGGSKPWRNKTDEIQLFVPFQQQHVLEQQITPFKIQQVKGENHKIMKIHKVPDKQARLDLFNPMRAANVNNNMISCSSKR